MAKKSLMQIALEQEQIEQEEAADEIVGGEHEEARRELEESANGVVEVVVDAEELDDEVDQRQEEAFALESLHAYGDLLRHQIASGTVTMESIALVQMGVQQVYASQGVRVRTIACENASVSPAAYAKVVLEQLALEAAYAESSFFSKVGTVLGTIIGKTESAHKLYEQRIEDFRKQYEELKPSMHGPISLNMGAHSIEYWRFFSTDAGQTNNLIGDLPKDVALTKHVIGEFAPKALAEFEKLVQILASGSLQDEQSAKRLALEIEKLHNPTDYFNKQFITGDKKPFFGVVGVDLEIGAKRKVLSVGGQHFAKLAELASTRALREKGSFKHGAKKFGASMAGGFGMAGAALTGKKSEISVQGIEQLIQFAEQYNHFVGVGAQFFQKDEAVMKKCDEVLGALQKKTAPEFKQLFNQIANIVEIFAYAAYSIVKDEQARAVKGAMHCLWAVLDTIALAKHAGKKHAKVMGKQNKGTASLEGQGTSVAQELFGFGKKTTDADKVPSITESFKKLEGKHGHPASMAEVGELYQKLRHEGTGLPKQLQELLRLSNGGLTVFGGEQLTAKGVYEEYKFLAEMLDSEDWEGKKSTGEGFTGSRWWEPTWVPFVAAGNGDFLCIDSKSDAIIEWRHDSSERKLLAPSLAAFLAEKIGTEG